MPEEPELTPLQQDQLASGWHFFLAVPAVYLGLSGYIDASRGYPTGGTKAATLHGLPPVESLPVANDGSGRVMLRLANWRVKPADIETLAPYIEQGAVSLITKAEFEALKPVQKDEI
jgi:hypothetical protein